MSTTEALLAASGSDGGNRVSIDDALAQHAGEFGRWQLRHFVLVTAAWMLEAIHTMVMIFADREPAMWCPAGDGRCGDRCAGAAAGWEWDQGSGSSTVAEWGLVCGERYKVGLVQAIYFAGCMIGSGVFGHLSDSFLGRKGSLKLVCFLSGGFGLLTSLSPNYWVYAAFRLLTGFSAGSICFCSFVLATEPIGPSYRGVVGTSICYFFSGGIAALVGVASLFRSSWRILYIVSGIFCTTASLIPDVGAMRVARMACGVVGIFGMAGTYNLLLVYAAELFPIVVRTVALGCKAQGSQMGAILAPIVVLLGERVPFVVFGVLAIIGGLLVLCLPETMNKALYDTMAGMEKGERSSKRGDEAATSNSLI